MESLIFEAFNSAMGRYPNSRTPIRLAKNNVLRSTLMLHFVLTVLFPVFTNHLPVFGFMIGALSLVGLAGLDLSRAARASAKSKNAPMQFLSRRANSSRRSSF
jgi:hypothetical protein